MHTPLETDLLTDLLNILINLVVNFKESAGDSVSSTSDNRLFLYMKCTLGVFEEFYVFLRKVNRTLFEEF